MLQIKRVYEKPSADDGYRVLVDRLWPRGISKDKAKVDLWLKEVGPSNELREWFGHDPKKWIEFKKRYRAELKNNSELENLKRIVQQHPKATLLFGARDVEHNQAIVLKEVLS